MHFIKTLIQPVSLGLMFMAYFWWNLPAATAGGTDYSYGIFNIIQRIVTEIDVAIFTVVCALYMIVFIAIYIVYSAYSLMNIFLESPSTKQLIKMFSVM